jgi:outer membrane lipoprotein-sorting protein
MKVLLWSLTVWSLFGAGVSFPQTPTSVQTGTGLDAVLERMDSVGREFRSLEADIERTKVVVFVNVRSTDFGKVYFAGAGDDSRIRLSISEPAEQHLLVADGKAQLYRPRINVLEEHDLGERGDIAEFLMIGFGASNQTLRDDYDVVLVGEEILAGIQTSILELEPKSERLSGMFPAIRLWVDQSRWIPVQSRLNEASGDYQIIKYSNIVLNGRFSSDVFKLDIPMDVLR